MTFIEDFVLKDAIITDVLLNYYIQVNYPCKLNNIYYFSLTLTHRSMNI